MLAGATRASNHLFFAHFAVLRFIEKSHQRLTLDSSAQSSIHAPNGISQILGELGAPYALAVFWRLEPAQAFGTTTPLVGS